MKIYRTLSIILAAAMLAGCAGTAREGRRVVSVRPNAAAVSAPVAETRKAVTAASVSVTSAQAATAQARSLAARTAEARSLTTQLDTIESTLTMTQVELTAALKAVTGSERSIAVLEAQIEQQTGELAQMAVDYNHLAAEKRAVEIRAASGRQRERILWYALLGAMALCGVLSAGLYIAMKGRVSLL